MRSPILVLILLVLAGGCRDKRIVDPTDPSDSAQLAFSRWVGGSWDIFVINSDGSNVQNLTNHTADHVNPAWSKDGSKLAFTSNRDGVYSIYVMNANGSNVRRVTTPPAPMLDGLPAWSPDGTRIAFTRFDRLDGETRIGGEIYLVNQDGTGLANFTNSPNTADLNASWSPDGLHLVWESLGLGPRDLFRAPVAGGERANVTNNSAGDDFKPRWSRTNGGPVAFTSNRAGGGNWSIFIVAPDGSGLRQLTTSPGQDSNSDWSPDGLRLAFNRRSSMSSPWDLYVISVEGTGLRRVTTAAAEPSWKP